MNIRRATAIWAAIVVGAAVATAAHADSGSGSIAYKGQTVAVKYAWLVTGPNDMEPGKTVRRLVMSSTHIGAKLQACTTFSCTDGSVTEGMTGAHDGRRREPARRRAWTTGGRRLDCHATR